MVTPQVHVKFIVSTMSYSYGASSARPGAAPYGPAAPPRSAMSVCSSIDRYTWSELEEELDLLPPPPEWMTCVLLVHI